MPYPLEPSFGVVLARTVWKAAQAYPGRTFSSASKQSSADLRRPEILNLRAWPDFLRRGVRPGHKAMLSGFFIDRRTQAWKVKTKFASMAQPHLLSQQFPCCAGGCLLDAAHLNKLRDVDAWESFRLVLGVG